MEKKTPEEVEAYQKKLVRSLLDDMKTDMKAKELANHPSFRQMQINSQLKMLHMAMVIEKEMKKEDTNNSISLSRDFQVDRKPSF